MSALCVLMDDIPNDPCYGMFDHEEKLDVRLVTVELLVLFVNCCITTLAWLKPRLFARKMKINKKLMPAVSNRQFFLSQVRTEASLRTKK